MLKVCVNRFQEAGFTFKPGFVVLVDDQDNTMAVTSGWDHRDSLGVMLFVYRPTKDGIWEGRWEDETTFPVLDALEMIDLWVDVTDLIKAVAYATGKELYVSENDVVFTDTVGGEKCNNGGEYGFYTRYIPLTEYPGIYKVYTETTCDFDACGTGYQGIRALTVREYRRLRRASDKIEAEGSLY